MLGSLGWQELVIVLIIVVIIFGAGKLPEIGGAVGKSIKEFKTQSGEDAAEITSGTAEKMDRPTAAAQDVNVKSSGPREVRADEI
jgi:sec-independent protein translocase protein TatA